MTSKKVIPAIAGYRIEDYEYLLSLIETEQIKVVVDRVFAIEDVAEAHSYVERGLKKGNVLINNQNDPGLYP